MKILFIVKERLVYGTKAVCYGLVNSCQFVVNSLKEKGYDVEITQVPDQNWIDRTVNGKSYTHVFLEALWVTPEKLKVLCKLHPHIHWILRIHSMIPFLVSEGFVFDYLNQFDEMRQNGLKISISCNNHKLHGDLKSIYKEVSYTPNIYYPKHDGSPNDTVVEKGENIINISCFGALRLLKNHAQQAIWAIRAANEKNKILHFHVNVSNYETNQTTPVLANLRAIFKNTPHRLVEHTWMCHNDFLGLVSKMDVALQLTFTETYNICAADAVSSNVPIVVSDEIDFVDPAFKVNISNPTQVLETIHFCLNKNQVQRMLSSNSNLLKQHNHRALEQWTKYLNSI